MSKIFSISKNGSGHFTYSTLYKIGGVGSALDSAWVIGSALFAYFISQFNDNVWALCMVVPIIFAYLVAVDWALFVFLPNTLKGLFSNTYKKIQNATQAAYLKKFYIGTLVYCLMTTGVTVSITIYLRDDAAHISTKKPELNDPTLFVKTSGEDLRRQISAIDDDIQSLKKERETAKYKAETSNKELLKLRSEGNGWAAKEINEKVNKASKKYDDMINEKMKSKDIILNQSSNTQAVTVAAITQANNFKIQDFNIKKGAISTLLMFFGIGSTVLQWYAAIMLAMMFTGLNIGKADDNFLGSSFSFINTLPIHDAAPHLQPVKSSIQQREIDLIIQRVKQDLETPTPPHNQDYKTVVPQVTQLNNDTITVIEDKTGVENTSPQTVVITKELLTRWRGDATTYFTRSKTQKTEEARRNSHNQYLRLKGFLESVGVKVIESGNVLDFPNYTTIRSQLENAKGVENG